MVNKIEVKEVLLKNLYWVYIPLAAIILLSSLSKAECGFTTTFIVLIPLSIIYTIIINASLLYQSHREAPFSSKLVAIIFSLVGLAFFGLVLILVLAILGAQLGCNFMG